MKKTLVILLLIIVGVIPSAELLGSTLKKNTLTILVPKSTSSLPILQLAREDPLPGVDIQAETFINHPRALALLLKGEVDLLLTGTSQGWNNYLDGGPVVMINTGVWGVSSLIGKDASIKRFSDLKGKKVALPFPGAPLDFQTRYILQKQGVDPDKDVELSYSPFGQTVPKLVKGQIDAAPFPEPLATNMVRDKGLIRLIDYKEAWAEVSDGDPRSPQVSLFATGAFSRQYPEILQEFVTYWRETSQSIRNNPEEVAQQFAELLAMSASVIEPAIRNTLFWVPSIAENRERVLAYYQLIQESFLPKSAPLSGEFFFSP